MPRGAHTPRERAPRHPSVTNCPPKSSAGETVRDPGRFGHRAVLDGPAHPQRLVAEIDQAAHLKITDPRERVVATEVIGGLGQWGLVEASERRGPGVPGPSPISTGSGWLTNEEHRPLNRCLRTAGDYGERVSSFLSRLSRRCPPAPPPSRRRSPRRASGGQPCRLSQGGTRSGRRSVVAACREPFPNLAGSSRHSVGVASRISSLVRTAEDSSASASG